MQILNVKADDRLLIVAPHPDDECIGPGGILALYPCLCKIIVLTDGRQGQGDLPPEQVKQIRKAEFLREMEIAGIHDYELLEYEDGSLMQHTECLESVDLSSFTKIFVTGIHDNHPDHTAACISVYRALKKQNIKEVEVYLYEVHAPLQEVSHMLDITEIIEQKVNYIRCHKSQLTSLAYDDMVKSLARFRALQNRMGNRYFETYTYMSPENGPEDTSMELERRLQKSVLFYWVLTRWMDIKIQGHNTAELIKKAGYRSLAIYGYAEIGRLLCKELIDTEIQIAYILDKKVKESGIESVPVYAPQQCLPEVDAVIVTAIYYFEEIKSELLQLGFSHVISFRNLLEEGV